MTRHFSTLCSFMAGLVLLVSGFLKLIDPIGTGFIMEEYFKFLGLGFMVPASVAAGIAVSVVEFLTGGLMMFRFRMRITTVVALIMMGFYLILTLFLAIFNPPMDCGCFGEAIHLTHFQTFIKNVVLTALCLPPFFKRASIDTGNRKWRVAYKLALLVSMAALLPAYSLTYRPFLDFTDFRPSALVSSGDGMSLNADLSGSMSFVYEKGGKRQSFTLDNLPDSTWTYVETVRENVLPDENSVVLSLRNPDGEYVRNLFVSEKNIVVSVYDTGKLDETDWARIASFCDSVETAGMSVMVAVAGDGEDGGIPEIIDVPVYYGDYKTLVTLNRSNGGFTYIAELSYPTVVEKWVYRMMDRVSANEIAENDPDFMLMEATARRNSFMRVVALVYILLIAL